MLPPPEPPPSLHLKFDENRALLEHCIRTNSQRKYANDEEVLRDILGSEAAGQHEEAVSMGCLSPLDFISLQNALDEDPLEVTLPPPPAAWLPTSAVLPPLPAKRKVLHVLPPKILPRVPSIHEYRLFGFTPPLGRFERDTPPRALCIEEELKAIANLQFFEGALSHDQWDPVNCREQLWTELGHYLSRHKRLRT